MVQARGAENPEVYLTFSPIFERIWLEAKKRLPECVSQKPANLGLRSQYSIRPTVNRRARPLKKLAAGAEYRVPELARFFGKRRRPWCFRGLGGGRVGGLATELPARPPLF